MSSCGWNYRIMMRRHQGTLSTGETYAEEAYGMVEAYYDEEHGEEVVAWTTNFMDPHGETREELFSDLLMMLAAFQKPTLDEEELEKRWAGKESPAVTAAIEANLAGETRNLRELIAELEAEGTPVPAQILEERQ